MHLVFINYIFFYLGLVTQRYLKVVTWLWTLEGYLIMKNGVMIIIKSNWNLSLLTWSFDREFAHTMQTLGFLDFSTKLSSAGLVYAHYGRRLIAQVVFLLISSYTFTLSLLRSTRMSQKLRYFIEKFTRFVYSIFL